MLVVIVFFFDGMYGLVFMGSRYLTRNNKDHV